MYECDFIWGHKRKRLASHFVMGIGGVCKHCHDIVVDPLGTHMVQNNEVVDLRTEVHMTKDELMC